MEILAKKAMVAQVDFGFTHVEGLMLPDGSYAIAATQIADKFQFDHNQASRTIKRILGNGFQFDQTTSEIHPKKVNILSIEQFSKLVVELNSRGDKAAKAFIEAALFESIERRFDAAFGVEVTERERNELLKARFEGVMTRRTLTDSIKDYCIRNDKSETYRKFVYTNVTECLNKTLFGKSAKELQADRNCSTTRNGLIKEEIINVDHCERTAMLLVDRRNVEPLEAMKQAVALHT